VSLKNNQRITQVVVALGQETLAKQG